MRSGSPSGPPPAALGAFRANGPITELSRGDGRVWRVGDVVLKRTEDDAVASWLCDLVGAVVENGFRVARPIRSRDGRWVAEGWSASRWVPGRAGPVGHWRELLLAARAFHRAISDVPWPAILDGRHDVWARADRTAWGEAPLDEIPPVADVARRLRRLTAPPEQDPQLVHGDLSGNVLFHPSLPPAVLDVSPYWRPAGYAEAIAVADGLLWWREGRRLLESSGRAGQPSLVARAVLFRLLVVNQELLTPVGTPARVDAALRPYRRATRLLEELVQRRWRPSGGLPVR